MSKHKNENDMSSVEAESYPQGFTMVPNKLMTMGSSFTDEEFRLLCVLLYHAFQKESCFPGRQKLANETGASVSKVDRVKKKLQTKRFINKQRRGQGLTNLYFPKIFFTEADKSPVSVQKNPQVTRKEYEVNNTKFNNYLDNQKSTTYKEKLPNSEPQSRTPNDVVTRSMLNKQIRALLTTNYQEQGVSREDIDIAKDVVCYYYKRYRDICGKEHTLYKAPQLRECFYNLILEINEIRELSYPEVEIPDIVKAVIERWFSSTSRDSNNLLLSHFVGGDNNDIFTNCFNALSFEDVQNEAD